MRNEGFALAIAIIAFGTGIIGTIAVLWLLIPIPVTILNTGLIIGLAVNVIGLALIAIIAVVSLIASKVK